MKNSILSVGVALIISVPISFAEPAQDHTDGPCFHVDIQNESVNRSNVQQSCDHNISRTVQAGSSNWSQTVQTGSINDNKVRQYDYDRAKYLDRMRGR